MDITTIAVEDTRDYAADATLAAPMLAALAESTDLETLEALANNPSIDTDTMAALALVGREDAVGTFWSVRWAIARREDLTVAIADEMLFDPRPEVISKLDNNSRVAEARLYAGELVSA